MARGGSLEIGSISRMGCKDMKHTKTWVLVADGSRARVLENLGPGKGLHQLPHSTESWLLAPSHELGTDQPGRVFNSTGNVRHALEATTDAHREQKRAFAQHLVKELDARFAAKAFDRLVLVAPPAMLGDLRDALPAELSKSVAGSVPKDLTHVPLEGVEEAVGEVLAV